MKNIVLLVFFLGGCSVLQPADTPQAKIQQPPSGMRSLGVILSPSKSEKTFNRVDFVRINDDDSAESERRERIDRFLIQHHNTEQDFLTKQRLEYNKKQRSRQATATEFQKERKDFLSKKDHTLPPIEIKPKQQPAFVDKTSFVSSFTPKKPSTVAQDLLISASEQNQNELRNRSNLDDSTEQLSQSLQDLTVRNRQLDNAVQILRGVVNRQDHIIRDQSRGLLYPAQIATVNHHQIENMRLRSELQQLQRQLGQQQYEAQDQQQQLEVLRAEVAKQKEKQEKFKNEMNDTENFWRSITDYISPDSEVLKQYERDKIRNLTANVIVLPYQASDHSPARELQPRSLSLEPTFMQSVKSFFNDKSSSGPKDPWEYANDYTIKEKYKLPLYCAASAIAASGLTYGFATGKLSINPIKNAILKSYQSMCGIAQRPMTYLTFLPHFSAYMQK